MRLRVQLPGVYPPPAPPIPGGTPGLRARTHAQPRGSVSPHVAGDGPSRPGGSRRRTSSSAPPPTTLGVAGAEPAFSESERVVGDAAALSAARGGSPGAAEVAWQRIQELPEPGRVVQRGEIRVPLGTASKTASRPSTSPPTTTAAATPRPEKRATAEPPVRQLGGLRVLRGVLNPASRRRRGPVALRPRLSPGVPLSSEEC